MLKMIFLFTIIPLLELFILIKLSHIWGLVFTISLVAITGLLGAFLTKKQGVSVVARIRKDITEGSMPADSIIEGFLILIGGVMLITPGILTDIGGFCCIIPSTRKRVKTFTRAKFSNLISTGNFQFSSDQDGETRKFEVYKDETIEKTENQTPEKGQDGV